MGYNPNFRINPEQLELIEEALRAEMGRLVKPTPQANGEHPWNADEEAQQEARKIHELLGHLHNQKRWYKPKDHVPLG